jgi:Sap-like sulfolipid-1-addressing protein
MATAVPYFAAIAIIVGSGVSEAAKLSLIALYCVVYALPLIAITAVVALKGNRAERILRPGGDWLTGPRSLDRSPPRSGSASLLWGS